MTQLGGRFRQALAYSDELHQAQRRKGSGAPYIAHLLGVAAIVLEHGGTEDEAIAALLHDAVEDQGGPPTLAAIQQRFGRRVAAIVAGCTDADTVPKPPWQERKEAYLAHLATADAGVCLVSAADKLYNLRTIVADYRAIGEADLAALHGGKVGHAVVLPRSDARAPASMARRAGRRTGAHGRATGATGRRNGRRRAAQKRSIAASKKRCLKSGQPFCYRAESDEGFPPGLKQ